MYALSKRDGCLLDMYALSKRDGCLLESLHGLTYTRTGCSPDSHMKDMHANAGRAAATMDAAASSSVATSSDCRSCNTSKQP